MLSSVASAGIFDWFGGITGMSTAEGENTDAPAEPAPEPMPEPEPEPEPEAAVEPVEPEPIVEDPTEGEVVIEDSGTEETTEGSADEWQETTDDSQSDDDWEGYDGEWEEPGQDCNEDSYWDGTNCVVDPNYYGDDYGYHDEEDGSFDSGHEDQAAKYGAGWCMGRDGNTPGQCCPDNICDDYELQGTGCHDDCYGVEGWQGTYPGGAPPECMDDAKIEELKMHCEEGGGTPMTDGPENCPHVRCDFQGKGGFMGGYGDDLHSQKENCEMMGLVPDVHPSMNGPVVECVPEGEQKFGFIDKEVDASAALAFALKLERIKIKLSTDSEVSKKIKDLQGYYENQGDTESAERFANALILLEDGAEGLDMLKGLITQTIEGDGKLTVANLHFFKAVTRYIVEESLEKVAYAILGANIEFNPDAVIAEDCTTDDCFQKMSKACAIGATFQPGGAEEGVLVKIVDNNNEDCLIRTTIDGESIDCTFTELQRRYLPISKEAFILVCPELKDLVVAKMGEARPYEGGEGMHKDYPEGFEPSGMICCQPEYTDGKACVVNLDQGCPMGYRALYDEWIQNTNEYNCVAHEVGHTDNFCETTSDGMQAPRNPRRAPTMPDDFDNWEEPEFDEFHDEDLQEWEEPSMEEVLDEEVI